MFEKNAEEYYNGQYDAWLEGEERYALEKENAELNGLLTKAKKIIKNLMIFAEIDLREFEPEYQEAKQFLREIDK